MTTEQIPMVTWDFFVDIPLLLTNRIAICGLCVNEMTTKNKGLNLHSWYGSNKQKTYCRTTKNSLYEKIC
jgi:hypothetical protein